MFRTSIAVQCVMRLLFKEHESSLTQGVSADDHDANAVLSIKLKKKPGKLTNNFEEKDKMRMEKEKKKIELEKKMKLSAEIQAVKEYYSNQQEVMFCFEALSEKYLFLKGK